MDSLPAELLTPILQMVHRGSQDSLLSCMRCNRKFHQLGFEILYKHVTLKLKDAIRFRDTMVKLAYQEERVTKFPQIRSLKLIVPGDGRDYGYTGFVLENDIGASKVIDLGITAFRAILPYLYGLRTFSIASYNGHRLNTFDESLGFPPITVSASMRRKLGPHINTLASVVRALPSTVRDLSIDLSELTGYPPVGDCLLCSAINRVAPRLEHLNLHLRSYCDELLHPIRSMDGPGYPYLQSIIIRIHGFNAKLCWKGRRAAQFTAMDIDKFTRDLRTFLANGVMPAVKQCIIISKRRRAGHPRQHSDTKWTIYVRELVSNQTAAIPRIFLDARNPSPGNSFIASARNAIRLPAGCTFIDEKYWDKEYVGKSGSIRRFVEGQAGWVAFTHGPHIPGFRKAEIKALMEEGYDLRAPPPSPASSFRKKHDKTCQLWRDEDAAGCRLLEANVWEGVLDNHVLDRAMVVAMVG